MASSKDMLEYVCAQLSGAGEITYKKMFGEWGLYCRGIYFGCVCNNQLFIKPTATNVELLVRPEPAPPCEGGKPYWLIDDLEDRDLLAELVLRTCAELPPKKAPRKKKQEQDY